MKRRRLHYTPRDYIVIGILVVFILWFAYLLVGIVIKEERARKAATAAEAELASLEEREETLRENIEELSTERGQEASLRETYGVARPGEEVIIVLAPEEEGELQELSWWRKFLGWFGL